MFRLLFWSHFLQLLLGDMYLVERVYLLMQVELCWYITGLTSLHFPGKEIKKINVNMIMFNIFIFSLDIFNRYSDTFTYMTDFKNVLPLALTDYILPLKALI